jgi:hypothetical protein
MKRPQEIAGDAFVIRRVLLETLTDGQLTGTADTSILRFANEITVDEQGTGVAGSAFDLSTTPANGTRVGIRRRGAYFVELAFAMDASRTIVTGFYRDTATVPAPAGLLTGIISPPTILAETVVVAMGTNVTPAAVDLSARQSGLVWVNNADAAAVGTPNGAILRFSARQTGGGVIADADVGVNNQCAARVTYVGDLDS